MRSFQYMAGGIICAAGLAACGGGGGSSGNNAVARSPAPSQSDFEQGTFQSASLYQDQCAMPRVGNFPDTQGTTADENNWLRSWSNELYLWYDEIVDENPDAYPTPEYFELMKTFAVTASGAPKDKFHFTIPTDEWQALSQSGVAAGYGAEFALLSAAPPREVAVALTHPNTPASGAGIARGTRILEVDGVDVVSGSDVDTLNAGLFPASAGEVHEFTVQDLGSAGTRTVTLTSATFTEDPVQFERVIDTPSGPVAYLYLNSYIATSEGQLVDAMALFESQSVTDLILDMRYNGGGFLDIANELAYMIAGPSAAAGRTFSEIQFNDKHVSTDPVTGEALAPEPFLQTTQGFSTPAGDPLPTLNLPRLIVLTGASTASASELVMNGLLGIDVEVIQIGSTTNGKPYGFYPFDNCGTTYFSIQFGVVNAAGFGAFGDGFSPANVSQVEGFELPGCSVADDFEHALGDTAEGRLAAALGYRDSGSCPAPTGVTQRVLASTHAPSTQSVAGAALTDRQRRMPGTIRLP